MKRILITGGTGTFGKAFVRATLQRHDVQSIRVYSRGEHAQADMRAEIPDQRVRFLVGDVRDLPRLMRAADGIDTLIHAAALKRVEVGEYNPDEMVKTNVLGTMNVIEAAIAAGVKRVVALSTDKACQPITTYGASKFMAEKLIIGANATGGGNTEFGVCRYGNVAGSNGSVIPYWKKLIEQDPDRILPVTDARCTRFWMTPKQAVDMVTWMATEDEHHLLAAPVLNAYRITDLAQAMWRPYHEVGMRAVEKIHETMWSEEEAKAMTLTESGYLTISATPRKTGINANGIRGSSDQADMMSVAELSRALSELEEA